MLVGTGKDKAFQTVGTYLPFLHDGVAGQIASGLLFLGLAIALARQAQKKVM